METELACEPEVQSLPRVFVKTPLDKLLFKKGMPFARLKYFICKFNNAVACKPCDSSAVQIYEYFDVRDIVMPQERLFIGSQITFTPLKIYNGTPEGRLNRDLRATLPINELKGKPPTEDCPILNLHRCKK
jgi:hypothetical protein